MIMILFIYNVYRKSPSDTYVSRTNVIIMQRTEAW